MERLAGWSGERGRRIRTALGVLVLALGVAGCGVGDRVGKQVEGTWVGDILFSQTDKVKLHLEGADYLNPDDRDQSLSVVVRVYQLSSLDKFRSASSQDLWDHGPETLGNTALDIRELTVVPGKIKDGEWPMAVAARYIGVAAFFRDELKARWKVALRADDLRKDGVLFSGDGARLLIEGNTLVVVRGRDILHSLNAPATASERLSRPLGSSAADPASTNPLLEKAATIVRESAEDAATNAAKRQATAAMQGALP